jgi:hypothetical protein
MQVFQTAGVPPNNGSKSLPNIGCNTNINRALLNNVPANKITGDNRGLVAGEVLFIIIF